MEALLLVIHVVVSFLLIIVVLLQSGKSADLSGAFGGAGSQSTFGPRGAASFLSRMTTTLAVMFMVTSLFLYIINSRKSGSASVLGSEEITQEQKADDAKTTPAKTEEKGKTGEEKAKAKKDEKGEKKGSEKK